MAVSQSLRGFIGQNISGRRSTRPGVVLQFPVGSHDFMAPVAGTWKFVMWGPGGDPVNNGSNLSGGASGGYVEYKKFLDKNQIVKLVVGRDTNTTAVFPDGKLLSAGAASANIGGVATGGDVNLNGTSTPAIGTGLSGPAGQGSGAGLGGTGSSAADGGAGAPALLPYRGGTGGSISSALATAPGGGGAAIGGHGANGMILVLLVS